MLLAGLMIVVGLASFVFYAREAGQVCTLSAEECQARLLYTAAEVAAFAHQDIPLTFMVAARLVTLAVGALSALAVGLLVVWRRWNDRMALLTALFLIASYVDNEGVVSALTRVYPVLTFLVLILSVLSSLLFVLFLGLFPNGRIAPRWMRGLLPVWSVLILILTAIPSSAYARSPLINLLVVAMGILMFGSLLVAQVLRYRHDSTLPERQQTKWAFLGVALFLVSFIVAAILTALLRPTGNLVLARAVSMIGFSLLPGLLPVFIGIAILRYRLFEIDVLVNRALVHGTLTAFVIGAYALIVVSLSALLRTQNNLALSLTATGLIAVAFQPVRERVQRAVNRLMYGERDEPYAVLSQLGQRLEATLSPDAFLPAIVETVAHALKLPYAAIALRQADEVMVVAEYGSVALSPPHPVTLSLNYQGEQIGELQLAPRAPGESFGPADQRLLRDLARQAGIALHAVQQTRRALHLADDLQRSRERIVTAREEERRRLRRDLHDGLGPQLASQTLTLDAIARLVRTDPDKAEDLLHSVREQSQQAIADIRELVYGLRPPALDDLGLISAIRQLADRLKQPYPLLSITVQVLDDLPPLSAAVEVAAYRIAQEALTNVVKHARATDCRVTLCLTDEPQAALILEIADNGLGIAADRTSGVGLQSMRERAEELGGQLTLEQAPEGGTRVAAELPLRLERTDS